MPELAPKMPIRRYQLQEFQIKNQAPATRAEIVDARVREIVSTVESLALYGHRSYRTEVLEVPLRRYGPLTPEIVLEVFERLCVEFPDTPVRYVYEGSRRFLEVDWRSL